MKVKLARGLLVEDLPQGVYVRTLRPPGHLLVDFLQRTARGTTPFVDSVPPQCPLWLSFIPGRIVRLLTDSAGGGCHC
jgi:hypothetical protein